MATKLLNMKWSLHNYKAKKLLIWGLKNGYIAPYDDVCQEIDEDMRRLGLKK